MKTVHTILLFMCLAAASARGQFTDVTASSGLGSLANSTGAAWGDYDNDGRLDLFISRFSSNTNNVFY